MELSADNSKKTEMLKSLENRCGSCTKFVTDFFESERRVRGHCGVRPRKGSINLMDYICDVYEMMPELKQLLIAQMPKVKDTPYGEHVVIQKVPMKPSRRQKETGFTVPDMTPAMASHILQTEFELMDRETLKQIFIDVLDEVLSISPVELGKKWHGGTLILQPANPELKPQQIPIENFFHKIIMVRDRLRVLEQQINSQKSLGDEEKVHLQQYITRCYGSLTSFNVLFKERSDQFVGQAKSDGSDADD